MSFFGELRRRNVFKVAVAYAIVGWLLIEISSTVFPVVQLPDWTVTFVTMLILLGFPIALVLSWAFELTPEGMKRSHDVPVTESITPTTGRKLDFAIIGALVLALSFVVIDNYVMDSGDAGEFILPNSVAVLPFDNMSADPEDAYFAAGLHDEIINQLAKLRSLNVIARTSVMQYAGAARPITAIATELNVGTIMEGSVSYADDRVAVRAQLIDAETGVHLWSDSYNRDLSDVFAIQADVAMNVANALQAEFSPEEQENIERIPTDSPEAYAYYLRALVAPTRQTAILLIDQAIEADPDFALAYPDKAFLHTFDLVGVGGAGPDEAPEFERLVQVNAERALSLDATLGHAQAALAVPLYVNWRGDEAETAFQRALAANPNDLSVLTLYQRFKRYRGEFDDSIRLGLRTVELDPNNLNSLNQLAQNYRRAAEWETASAIYSDILDRGASGVSVYAGAGTVEAMLGNHADAVRLLQIAEEFEDGNAFRLAQIAHAYSLASETDGATRLFREFEQIAENDPVGEAIWSWAYISVGDYGQALQRVESAVRNRTPIDLLALTSIAANPWRDSELEKPEFRELLDDLWN